MRTIHTVILGLLCGSACATDGDLTGEDHAADDGTRADAPHHRSPGADPDVCDLLPSAGPCAVACDPVALAAYLPPGTCGAFVCELVDGREASFHTCHPET